MLKYETILKNLNESESSASSVFRSGGTVRFGDDIDKLNKFISKTNKKLIFVDFENFGNSLYFVLDNFTVIKIKFPFTTRFSNSLLKNLNKQIDKKLEEIVLHIDNKNNYIVVTYGYTLIGYYSAGRSTEYLSYKIKTDLIGQGHDNEFVKSVIQKMNISAHQKLKMMQQLN